VKQANINSDSIREIALSLPSSVESPHFDRTSFRVNKKIFATLRSDKDECVLKLNIADQTALLGSDSETFYEVGWAHQGWIGIQYTKLPLSTLSELFESAWRNVASKTLVNQFDSDKQNIRT